MGSTTPMEPMPAVDSTLQQELQFRLSLLRLMTEPHDAATPPAAARQLEELVQLPLRSKRD